MQVSGKKHGLVCMVFLSLAGTMKISTTLVAFLEE